MMVRSIKRHKTQAFGRLIPEKGKEQRLRLWLGNSLGMGLFIGDILFLATAVSIVVVNSSRDIVLDSGCGSGRISIAIEKNNEERKDRRH